MVSTLSIVAGNGTKEFKMNKLSTIFFASFALVACAGTPHPAISAEDPNILILGEDSDPDSVPRNNRICAHSHLRAGWDGHNKQEFVPISLPAVSVISFSFSLCFRMSQCSIVFKKVSARCANPATD